MVQLQISKKIQNKNIYIFFFLKANGRPRSTRASTKKVPGISKCFKCGEAGHWSKYCRGPKGDQLLPVDAVNEDEPELCPYPSLEEAEKMAQAPEHANRLVNINWKVCP